MTLVSHPHSHFHSCIYISFLFADMAPVLSPVTAEGTENTQVNE